jgi:C-terminal processing protease CtpA/Prc
VSNYGALLFQKMNYTLSFGRINGSVIEDLNRDIALTAEVVPENPIHVSKILTIEGMNIGYLMYNRFLSEYDQDLDSVFAGFKSEAISELVLDLRYNPGGSASTALLLASLIAPESHTSAQSVFVRYLYNENVTNYFIEQDGPESSNLIGKFEDPGNNLDLDRIYILITENSASASELIINGLDPYMDVILIGPESTSGKYTGSITVEDEKGDHGWAMQPIVSKIANSMGTTDYSDGFSPDYLIEDGLMTPLGDLNENMLAQAISLITGIPGPARISQAERYESLLSGGMEPVEQRQEMWIELDLNDHQIP